MKLLSGKNNLKYNIKNNKSSMNESKLIENIPLGKHIDSIILYILYFQKFKEETIYLKYF